MGPCGCSEGHCSHPGSSNCRRDHEGPLGPGFPLLDAIAAQRAAGGRVMAKECPNCNGKGWHLDGFDAGVVDCEDCHGTGKLDKGKPMTAHQLEAIDAIAGAMWDAWAWPHLQGVDKPAKQWQDITPTEKEVYWYPPARAAARAVLDMLVVPERPQMTGADYRAQRACNDRLAVARKEWGLDE